MSLRRLTARAVLAVTAMAATAVAGAATADAAPTTYRKYVALGDSYSAGPGVPWLRLDHLGCVKSTNNYPAWLAYNLGVGSYTDATCSAADTTHMTQWQWAPLGGWYRPQLDALTSDTDLVTIGIGGNDFGVFGELTGTCPTLTAQDPTGSPCRDSYTVDGVDTMKAKVRQTGLRIKDVLAKVHERSPNAKVMLVGYPRIAPPTGYCPDILPFADGDLRWLDSVEIALNRAIAGAAKADGRTTYVDTYTPSLGHDACAPNGAAWVQGKANDLFAAIQYHPFKAGMVAEASLIQKALTGKTPAVTAKSVNPFAVPDSVDKAVVGTAATTRNAQWALTADAVLPTG